VDVDDLPLSSSRDGGIEMFSEFMPSSVLVFCSEPLQLAASERGHEVGDVVRRREHL
jgi:hypothetical protein